MNNQSEKIKMDDMPLKRWSLKFNEALEAEYQEWAAEALLGKWRFALVAGLLLMALLAAADLGVFAANWGLPLILHLAVGLATLGAALALTNFEWGQRYITPVSYGLMVVLQLLQFVLFWQTPNQSLVYLAVGLLSLGLLLAYDLTVLARDFLAATIWHGVVYLMVLMRLTALDYLPLEWRVALSMALLTIYLLSGFVLYQRLVADRRFYYATKGQSRFADKVAPLAKSDPVIKRIESPINKMFYAVSDVIWFITTDGDVAYVSPSVKEFMGYEPEELIGKRAITLMPVEVYRDFEAKMTRLYKDKNIVQDVFSFRTKAGLLKSGETHARAYTDNERGDGYVASTRPISDEKVKAQATSQKKMRDLIEQNDGLKSDVHDLTAELATLTEKLTIVNREMAASGKIGQKTFSKLLSDLLIGYETTLLPSLETQRGKLRQLSKKFNDKTMGKYDLQNFLEQAQRASKAQVDQLAFVRSCQALYAALSDESQIETATHDLAPLCERAVLDLKAAFGETDHVVNIDCADQLTLETNRQMFGDLLQHLLLNSLTQQLRAVKKGVISIKLYQFRDELLIEYQDNGETVENSEFEQFYLHCLAKNGYRVADDGHLVDYFVTERLAGTISRRATDGVTVTVIALPNVQPDAVADAASEPAPTAD